MEQHVRGYLFLDPCLDHILFDNLLDSLVRIRCLAPDPRTALSAIVTCSTDQERRSTCYVERCTLVIGDRLDELLLLLPQKQAVLCCVGAVWSVLVI